MALPVERRVLDFGELSRAARRGWVGKKVAFLSILPVIRHYQPTYDQWTLPRKT